MAEDPETGTQSEDLPAESNEQSTSSYWNLGGWVSFAKEKSKKTIDLMKKDFAELSTVVRTDAVGALARTVDNVKQKVTKSNIEGARDAIRTNVTKLIDDVSKKVAVVPPDDSETSACIITEDGELKTLNQFEFRIYKLSQNAATFLVTPESDTEFNTWNAAFDVNAHNDEISELLVEYVSLRKFYNELVPAQVSHTEFWRNALFRIEQAKRGAPQPIATPSVSATVSSPEQKDEHVEVAVEVTVSTPSLIPVKQQEVEHVNPSEHDQGNTTVRKTDAESHLPIAQDQGTVAVSQGAPELASQTSDPSTGRLETLPAQDSQSQQAEIKTTVEDSAELENNREKAGTKTANDGQEPDSNDEWEKWDA